MTEFISGYMPRNRVTLDFPEGEGRTKQNHRDECDINRIMAKYQKTGVVEHLAKHRPEYGFATSHDFQSAMELTVKAQAMFNDLPSKVRARFNNNPAEFLSFVETEGNDDEKVRLGLLDLAAPLPAAESAAETPPAEIPPAETPPAE